VSVSSASRWSARYRREGQVAPKPTVRAALAKCAGEVAG
jgi:hypothetical protein